MTPLRPVLAGCLAVAVLTTAACLGPDTLELADIAPAEGMQRLNAVLVTPLPATFTPRQARDGQTSWGSAARTIQVLADAPLTAVTGYLRGVDAQLQTQYRGGPSCPPTPAAPAEGAAPADTPLTDWYEREAFDRCATVQSWTLPPSELNQPRSAGGVYVQQSQTGSTATVLVVVSMA